MRTGNLETLRWHLGEAITLKFIANFGGREVSIPSRKQGQAFERFVCILGLQGAMKLVDNFAGEQFYCPISAQDQVAATQREMVARYAKGESIEAIAREVKKPAQNYTTRWVRKIVGDARESGQLSMAFYEVLPHETQQQ